MVTDNYVIKIADFGLARDVGQDNQDAKTSTVSGLTRAKLSSTTFIPYFCSEYNINKMNRHLSNLLEDKRASDEATA